MIPKSLFFIWIGARPKFTQFAVDSYKRINPSFTVNFVHYPVQQLEQLYFSRNAKTDIDQLCIDVIDNILGIRSEYNSLVTRQAIQLSKTSDIPFVQLFCDVLRLALLNKFGGLYVDCDTFPLKPFDDKLLQLKRFMVARHYNNIASSTENNIGDDNYFLGSMPSIERHKSVRLLQTCNKWWINMQYIINKKKFFDLSLQYQPNLDQPLYIEHYCDGNWKWKNGRIRTQECFLDEIYYGKRKNSK